MKISVIMLTYNRPDYLKIMIENIRKQTFKDFEFIIIDNGSNDNTGDLVDKYVKADKRIQCVHLIKAESIGKGRNVGLQMAQGDYVSFVDDDDRVEPDFLEFLYNLAKENKADISMCGATELLNGEYAPQCMFDEKFILTPQEAVLKLLERKYIRAGMPTKLIKRKILLNDLFIEDVKHEDIHTIYKYISNAGKIAIHGLPKYCFVRHGNNISFFTSDVNKITPELLVEYRKAFCNRTHYLTGKFPELKGVLEYSEWSYMLSMCDKIQQAHLVDCDEQFESMREQLLKNYDRFIHMKYIKDFEKLWLEKYIL